MAWEHLMAKELKKRDNREAAPWVLGKVLSPVRTGDSFIGYSYEGPLIVSCCDGEIILKGARLKQLPSPDGEPYYKGQTVALLGNLFGSGPGSQIMLILGEVQDAI